MAHENLNAFCMASKLAQIQFYVTEVVESFLNFAFIASTHTENKRTRLASVNWYVSQNGSNENVSFLL